MWFIRLSKCCSIINSPHWLELMNCNQRTLARKWYFLLWSIQMTKVFRNWNVSLQLRVHCVHAARKKNSHSNGQHLAEAQRATAEKAKNKNRTDTNSASRCSFSNFFCLVRMQFLSLLRAWRSVNIDGELLIYVSARYLDSMGQFHMILPDRSILMTHGF